MEPLKEISKSEWKELHDLFLTNWPYGIVGYCLLDMLLANPNLVTTFNFVIYSPRGIIQKGMIAVSDTETHHLYICPIKSENLACLEEALAKTRVVNWNNNIIVPSVSSDVMKMIDRLGNALKFEIKCNGFVVRYLKSVESKPYPESDPPPDTHVGNLKPEHLSLVDATWAFHSTTSSEYFRRLMDNNLTYVLYNTTSNQPLAWVAIDETGSLTHLYSIERCRRQGYASYITKVATNAQLSKGQHVIAYSLVDNFASQRFFVKMGFRNLGVTSWISVTRKQLLGPSCAYCRILDFHPCAPPSHEEEQTQQLKQQEQQQQQKEQQT